MKSSSRILLGFGIVLAVLIIAAIVLVFTLGQSNVPLLAEDTPQGAVQRYLQSVQEGEYSKAYSFISPVPAPTDKGYPPSQSFEYWVQSAQNSTNSNWRATLRDTTINGNNATVGVTVEVFRSGGLFDNPIHSNQITFALKKEGGVWLITSPVDLYWIY
jgi:hypothetical protein